LSGLIKFKFGFENLLKICFEKLEKKKKRKIIFFRFLAQSSSRPASTRPTSPAPAIFRVGRAQTAACWPSRARRSFVSLACGTHLSGRLLPQAAAGFPLSFFAEAESFPQSPLSFRGVAFGL
jgi:hypothetical protein